MKGGIDSENSPIGQAAEGSMRHSMMNSLQFYRYGTIYLAIFVLAVLIVTLLLAESDLVRLGIIAFYLFGSIPFAYIFTYIYPGKTEFAKGTVFFGVSNSFRIGGYRAGLPTLFMEIFKGVLPFLASFVFFNYDLTITILFVFASLLGTNFSVFLKFVGGMGTTILMWSILLLSPITLVIWMVIFYVVAKTIYDSYYGALINYAILPLLLFVIERNMEMVIFAIAVAIIFILKYDRSKDEIGIWYTSRKQRA
jgi:glycerol-3-phosphate acyltransferase PlsY